jgi:hypothetical protein
MSRCEPARSTTMCSIFHGLAAKAVMCPAVQRIRSAALGTRLSARQHASVNVDPDVLSRKRILTCSVSPDASRRPPNVQKWTVHTIQGLSRNVFPFF